MLPQTAFTITSSSSTEQLLSDVNKVLSNIPTNDLAELHHLLHCITSAMIENFGVATSQNTNVPCNTPPAWKIRFWSNSNTFKQTLVDYSVLRKKLLHRRNTIALLFNHTVWFWCYVTCEYLRQKIHAYTCRLNKYELKWVSAKQN